MNDQEYEQNEARQLAKQMREIESAPLNDRREARKAFSEALAEAGLVAERVGWILNGSYGWGACMAAKRIVDNTRMNRAAALGRLVAALEWQCPADFARRAFLSLAAKDQARVNAEIMGEIKTTEFAVA